MREYRAELLRPKAAVAEPATRQLRAVAGAAALFASAAVPAASQAASQNNCITSSIRNSTTSSITNSFTNSITNSTTNSIVNRQGTAIEVQGITIADLIAQQGLTHVDFIKCDIEGSEMAAITDETVAAVKDIVDCWFIEVHQTEQGMTWENSLSKNKKIISDIFKRQGYGVQELRFDSLYIYKEADASNT